MVICPHCNFENNHFGFLCKQCHYLLPEEEIEGKEESIEQYLQSFGYILDEEIGKGSIGTVYLAEHILHKRKVAIKILSNSIARNDFHRKKTFLNVGEKGMQLKHKNIGEIYDISDGEYTFYAMEYGEGGSLDERIKIHGGAVPIKEALDIVIKILNGLEYAHSNGIQHMDVRPETIFFRKDGEPFLTEFSISKIISSPTHRISGLFPELIYYTDPEFISAGMLEHRTDQYPTGILLYRLLVGTLPFTGTDREVVNMHRNEKLPSLQGKLGIRSRGKALPPALVGELDAILGRLCEKNIERRFATAGEVSKKLTDIYQLL